MEKNKAALEFEVEFRREREPLSQDEQDFIAFWDSSEGVGQMLKDYLVLIRYDNTHVVNDKLQAGIMPDLEYLRSAADVNAFINQLIKLDGRKVINNLRHLRAKGGVK